MEPLLVDDPIKPEDALFETIRERVNNRFESTIRNRVNSRNTPIIIIMQRLHEHDLCGYPSGDRAGVNGTVLSLPRIWHDENGCRNSLWGNLSIRWRNCTKSRDRTHLILETQHMQNPKPLEGLMDGEFKTYDIIPYAASMKRKNPRKSADTGSDHLCSICYTETPRIGNFGHFYTLYIHRNRWNIPSRQQPRCCPENKDGRSATFESNNGGAPGAMLRRSAE